MTDEERDEEDAAIAESFCRGDVIRSKQWPLHGMLRVTAINRHGVQVRSLGSSPYSASLCDPSEWEQVPGAKLSLFESPTEGPE